MEQEPCQLLHDYLAGELNARALQAFESHLNECNECRAEVELQRIIEQSLVRANQQAQPPPGLFDVIHRQTRRASRRRLAWTVSAAAAALLLAGSAVFQALPSPQNDLPVASGDDAARQESPGAPENNSIAEQAPEIREIRPVQLTFPDDQDIIAVEMETQDPTVTIVMVYPTVGRPLGEAPE